MDGELLFLVVCLSRTVDGRRRLGAGSFDAISRQAAGGRPRHTGTGQRAESLAASAVSHRRKPHLDIPGGWSTRRIMHGSPAPPRTRGAFGGGESGAAHPLRALGAGTRQATGRQAPAAAGRYSVLLLRVSVSAPCEALAACLVWFHVNRWAPAPPTQIKSMPSCPPPPPLSAPLYCTLWPPARTCPLRLLPS